MTVRQPSGPGRSCVLFAICHHWNHRTDLGRNDVTNNRALVGIYKLKVTLVIFTMWGRLGEMDMAGGYQWWYSCRGPSRHAYRDPYRNLP